MQSRVPTLAEYQAGRRKALRQVSLCLLLREGEVLLASKKHGFGVGKWTGVGGKPEPGETIEATVVRETEEEIGVTPLGLRRVATLDFFFPYVPDEAWDQQVCVYITQEWRGEPVETEEVAPRWFAHDALLFPAMWSDAPYWLPPLLRGESVVGQFIFDEAQQVLEHVLTPARSYANTK
jgi:8-oxo-dGTP diphosphatase